MQNVHIVAEDWGKEIKGLRSNLASPRNNNCTQLDVGHPFSALKTPAYRATLPTIRDSNGLTDLLNFLSFSLSPSARSCAE